MAPIFEKDLTLKATELRLGLPGREEEEQQEKPSSSTNLEAKLLSKKRSSYEMDSSSSNGNNNEEQDSSPPPKAQIVGWPPVRSYRRNVIQANIYVKVSMDGAAYLRKIDLKFYKNYAQLLKALENMFKCTIGVYSEREGYNGSDYVPTYEDKDGDWMLVGDVPWEMFINSCKRLRIMKGCEAKGLAICL